MNKMDNTSDFELQLKIKATENYPLMTEIKSSNVKALGYNDNSNMAVVRFNNNSEYAYFNVIPEDFQNLSNAESKGKQIRIFASIYKGIKIK
jgi:hypothetical protein